MLEDFYVDFRPFVESSRLFSIIHLQWKGQLGSGFIALIGNGQCWVTARHVIEGALAGDELLVFNDNQWKTLKLIEVFHSTVERDVSVFTTNVRFNFAKPIDLSDLGSVRLGQNIIAFGFPHGIIQLGIDGIKSPTPLCKSGSFAGVLEATQGQVLLMDALINPGFSGGPVFYCDHHTKTTKVLGIVSALRPEEGELGSIYDTSTTPPIKLPNLKTFVHSGFTYLVPIKEARDLAGQLTKFPSN